MRMADKEFEAPVQTLAKGADKQNGRGYSWGSVGLGHIRKAQEGCPFAHG